MGRFGSGWPSVSGALRALIPALVLTMAPGLMLPFGVAAQTQSAGTRIEVSGTGTVEVQPDFATLNVGMQVVLIDASSAGDSLAVLLDRVVDALEGMGFPSDSLSRRRFSVSPSRNTLQGGAITGYIASANLRVRTGELSRLSEIVETALLAGATDVNQIVFGSTRTDELREEALRLAIIAAERDASILAEARGGRLGELLEVGMVWLLAR